ncbi:MAG: DegT/DnrJ/EryC1/StrS family aminotransferase [Gammaproteobacteria bacterium]|nr:DegT/DnrJ/EryC1/StrS family aminotransferase [Gammaproteobacteria bacterium]
MEFIDLKTQYQRLKPAIQARINAVLDHGKYILGPEVGELETCLAEYVGTRHCIAVSSGTDALLLSMMALEIQPGDEVITSPFSFIATVETIALLGAKPVFADINPKTLNIDPAAIEAAVTPATRAIMPVSLYGQCADMDAINAIADKHGLAVIEDGAQSFGATYKGRRSCSLSTIGCTSFFPSKPLGCYGDAGACFTDDDELATRLRQLRIHGQERRYYHTRAGINGRIDTIQAAILLAKMEIFPDEVEKRIQIGTKYSEALKEYVGVPYIEPHNNSVYAQYTIQIENRNELANALHERGIPTAVHYPEALHLQPAFTYLNIKQGALPYSELTAERVLSLPMHPYLTEHAQNQVIEAVQEAITVLCQN